MSLLSNIALTLRNSQANSVTTVQNDVNLFSVEEAVNGLNQHVNQLQIAAMAYINTNINADVSTNNTWVQIPGFTLGPNTLVNLVNNAFVLPNNLTGIELTIDVSFSGVGLANAIIEMGLGTGINNVGETYKQIRKWDKNDTGAFSLHAAHSYLAGEELGLYLKDTNAQGGNMIVRFCQFKIQALAP